ncbi:MAG TPA: methylated-DNA--[protein]-cysteine S-methyltransferase [Elusimicrobiota bacterium]|nr:methylated-DNA--[protein]-cysteine S-methyltransferase [Elusimicrobiota bacterium]
MNAKIKDAWESVVARDPRADGKFVFAVTTTGIYCRPSCPARRPLRENVSFFRGPAAAEAAGFRECRRCRPRSEGGPAAGARLVREACRLIVARAEAEEGMLIADVARQLNVSPSKLSRLFARHAGMTPKKFSVARRFDKFKKGARTAGVTESQYAAGFGSASRLYEAARSYLGMTPGAYAKGGKGEVIAYGCADSPVGRLLIASTARGLCSVEIGDSDAALMKRLKARFPNAELRPDAKAAAVAAKALTATLSGKPSNVKLDPRGTAFQRRVWDALREIPAGRTKTYGEVAREIGRPRATRAVARAIATNCIALAIPCHRVVGASGRLSGYRWGPERKRRLLDLERARDAA